ncbi:uncharacterized protein SPAPADRAFT_67268 [Spathaspora passalidarum NRRL Y-27907]|uniref:Hyphally-regulated cell wall protein N-terminal domain-containing protein n=1 Tax=Spathaspora passalidarum (strain NRRL Y-27907 / 11-Y1) TaxID=619300 RepID=G3APG5_SPAPN|nr:uncharacterized protein SPAPADRAFT_67268 [Spathaspora passalidarum NRRL Y-27907]EGW32682.1 hypothetical protein SPAPADRAFT_67268 [Spathaspora passalidarum NRRL Y-27907]
MWIIRFLILLQTAVAITINYSEIITNPPDITVFFGIPYYITEQGSLMLEQLEHVQFNEDLVNYGQVLITKTGFDREFVVKVDNLNGIFLNGGLFNVQASSDVATSFEIDVESFTNIGIISVSSKATSGDPYSRIMAHKVWDNQGTIKINNQAENQGILDMGPCNITNNGMIELYNQNYKQGLGEISGEGCIFLEENTNVELNSEFSSAGQTFVMGENSTLFVTENGPTNEYKVMNFSMGNRIGLDGFLHQMTYGYDGILILKSLHSIQRFIIGKGYSELDLTDTYVTYDRDAPAYMVGDCKDFPFDDFESESTSNIETAKTSELDESTTIEEMDTTTDFEDETSELYESTTAEEKDTTTDVEDETRELDESTSEEDFETTTSYFENAIETNEPDLVTSKQEVCSSRFEHEIPQTCQYSSVSKQSSTQDHSGDLINASSKIILKHFKLCQVICMMLVLVLSH